MDKQHSWKKWIERLAKGGSFVAKKKGQTELKKELQAK